ncbi:MAG TPA: endonuclease VIII [Ruminococcaceae bacterium]|nr:endonuclease VIII [Oscillospiraceae bacterium]
MMELPESHNLAKQLNETLKGKVIRKAAANSSPHGFAFYFGDPALYNERLTKKPFGHAQANGGQLELFFGDMRVALNDGANLRYFLSEAPLPKKHQLYIEFEDSSSLVVTVQMYAGIMAFKEGEHDNFYYKIAKEKPTPLGSEFDLSYFKSLKECEKYEKLSAKAFLATEQRIPGLGNGVLQDILWNALIHPKTKMGALTAKQFDILYKAVKGTLAEMTREGGRDTERDIFGHSGGYICKLSKNTLGRPCERCGTSIEKAAYLGGAVYFCPACQPVITAK